MSKPCLIIGCGSHCYSVISIIETLSNYKIVGLLDTTSTFNSNESKSGHNVINSLQTVLTNSEKFKHYDFAIAVGDNQKRAEIYSALIAECLNVPNFISKYAVVDRTVKMGHANIISHNVVINAMAIIGNNNLINTASIIEHNVNVGHHNHIAPISLLCGNTVVSNYCLIGAGAKLLPNVKVEINSTVGAGSVLLSNVNRAHTTLVGIPAREK